MIYEMKLQNAPFQSIKSGAKDIEMRLYDEKRKLLKVGDNIKFTNLQSGEIITVEIIGLHQFSSFAELYKNFDKTRLGYNIDEIALPSDMEQYYSADEQKKYGVVGIEIKLV